MASGKGGGAEPSRLRLPLLPCLTLFRVTGCDRESTGSAPPAPPGQAIYRLHCASCHLANGAGPPGNSPSLAETADVLTYLRTSWGNAASPITWKEVERAHVRFESTPLFPSPQQIDAIAPSEPAGQP